MSIDQLTAFAESSSLTTRPEGGLRARAKASAAHLAVSALIASCVLGAVYFGWYRSPLDSISGVREIVVLLLAIDVVLGPLLTFVVFDRRKKRLALDIAGIAVLQLGALGYGVYTLEVARPHYLVFVKDRFDVVSRADLLAEDRSAAADNEAARENWFGPTIVAAEMPTSEDEKRRLLFESVQGGRDVQHFPKQYRAYASQAATAASRSAPISMLRTLNPDRLPLLQAAIEETSLPEERLGFLPVKGAVGDAAMLVDVSSGAVLDMLDLVPWR